MSPRLEAWLHDGTALRRRGRAERVPGKLSRSQRQALEDQCRAAGRLVRPLTSADVGLLPGWTYADLEPVVAVGSSPVITWGTTHRANQLVWGPLSVSKTAPSTGSNMALAGPRPDLIGQGHDAAIRETDQHVHTWSLQDYVIDPMLWTRPELNPPGGAWSVEDVRFLARNLIGIRGGRYKVRFGEIINVQDARNVSTAMRDTTTDPILSDKPYFRCNWVHRPAWYKGPGHAQPEGTHSDLDQNSKPMYMQTEFNQFGGPTPGGAERTATPVAYNLGDGSVGGPLGHGQGTFLQQETWNLGGVKDDMRVARGAVWRGNLYWQHEGDGFDINHYYDPTYPNPMSDFLFADNMHAVRPDGRYVTRSSQYAPVHVNHRLVTISDGVITDVGAAPVRNG